jgi:hypothetical protein
LVTAPAKRQADLLYFTHRNYAPRRIASLFRWVRLEPIRAPEFQNAPLYHPRPAGRGISRTRHVNRIGADETGISISHLRLQTNMPPVVSARDPLQMLPVEAHADQARFLPESISKYPIKFEAIFVDTNLQRHFYI